MGDSICETSEGKPEAHAALLSLHYFAARRWNDAWRFSLLAGDGAKEIYANLEAARFYERAAEAARFMPMIGHTARAEVLRSLGDVKERAGLFTEAVEAYRRSSQLTDDTVALADLKLKRAVVRMRLGSFSQALRDVSAGQRLLEGVNSVEASRVRAQLLAHGAQVRMAQEQDRMAIEMARARPLPRLRRRTRSRRSPSLMRYSTPRTGGSVRPTRRCTPPWPAGCTRSWAISPGRRR